MEISKKPAPSAEELLRKILDLESRHDHIKQEISKLLQRSSNSPFSHPHPLSTKLTEAQYFSIIQSMGQAIHIFDHKYRIFFWNRAAEEIYSLKAAEVYGKTPTEILVDPKDAVMADYLLERTVNGESWSGEFPVTNKNGETFVVVCTNTPFRDENRRLIGGMCVSFDSHPYRSPSSKTEHMRKMMIDSPHTAKISHLTNGNAGESEQIDGSAFGVFSMMNKSKNGIQKMLLSKAEEWIGVKRWKRIEREDESLVAKLFYFGWQRLNHIEEQEQVLKPEAKASGIWLSTVRRSGSSTSSSSSGFKTDGFVKTDVETTTDSLDYEILWEDLITKRQIGQGSCGTVYHGLWYGSDVAIKVFIQQGYPDDVMVSFKQEVSLMKRLRHPNIVLFMGAVTACTHLCIVTEFLPRGSLFHTLQRSSTRLDRRRRLQMAIDIAQGMNYLHQCNPPIVHRDLKSSNLLVNKNWTVKVCDFGLSRIKHQTYLKTKSGRGTPQWMAPEIIRNEQADEKSDVYSYGVVLWEIITNKIPWDDLNPMQVIAAVGFMNRRLDIPKYVDPLWASLIQSCWCSDPRTRPTFQEILYKLKDIQKKMTIDRRR